MDDLGRVARKYHAFEQVDKSAFQRRARVLQSLWRSERGYDIGTHFGPKGTRPLGSRLVMPWAEETLANYLTDTVRQVIRNEVLNKEKSQGKLFARPRIFSDLLSSQPLCFNLFGELQQNLALATDVIGDLTSGRVRQVTGIEFEHSPGRSDPRYTGDNSAFDVYVTFQTAQRGLGFIGIEVKYHENLRNKPARHRSRYEEIAEMMGCFRQGKLNELKGQPLQQIWRDHLLAGSLRREDGFDDGFSVFLYPQGNQHCANAVRAYRECLSACDTFVEWTLEDVAATIRRHTQDEWIDRFIDRYLDFDKLRAA